MIHNSDLPLTESNKKFKAPLNRIKFITDKYFIKAKETQHFTVNKSGFISFNSNFKYLESWISYDLNDSFNIVF